MQPILAYIEMRIAMLSLAMSKDTLDRQHIKKLLQNIENAVMEIRKELDLEK